MRNEFDVIIVGAGMAGATLACALSSGLYPQLANLRIGVLEAREIPSQEPPLGGGIDSFDPRVSALTRASCDFFSRLGVWQEIQAMRSCEFRHMQVWDARGTASIGFDADAVGANQLGYIVENRVITAALHKVLRARPQVTIRDGTAVAKIVPDSSAADFDSASAPSHGAVLELANGETLHAQLLVAADGAGSQCREAMGIPVRAWDYGQDAIVCSVEVEHSHAHTAWQNFTADGPLAFLPLAADSPAQVSTSGNANDAMPAGAHNATDSSRHYCSIVWSQSRPRAAELLALPDVQFKQQLARALEFRLGSVLDVSPRASFALQQQHAQNYVASGFALIADAAHTIHPLAGQGINLGFADVQCLAQSLDEAAARQRPLGELAALMRYQRARKTDNLAMMALVEGFKRLYQPVPPSLMWLRNWGMRQVDQQTWLKNHILKYAMGLD